MAGGFGSVPKEMLEALVGKKKSMSPEQRKKYWREHFKQRLYERYGIAEKGESVHEMCQKAIEVGHARKLSGGSTEVYKVFLASVSLEQDGHPVDELEIYCNFDRYAQYVTSCLPPEEFE